MTKERLQEILSAMRNTENEGLTPDQRKYAKRYADKLEQIIKDDDYNEFQKFLRELKETSYNSSHPPKRHIAKNCARRLDEIEKNSFSD